MANHRWDTEPPAVLPSRLAARRRAAGIGFPPPEDVAVPATESRIGAVQEDGWTGLQDIREAEPDVSVSAENPRRWRFPVRAGVLAACLMLAAAAAVPLLRDRAVSEVLSVELGSNLVTAGSDPPPAAGSAGARNAQEEQPLPGQEANPSGGPPASGEPDTPEDAAAGGTQLVVHVAGAVVSPGLVRIPVAGRVADAVAAAGGATGEADLTRVNLAAPMTDGSMVIVPARGDPNGPVEEPGATGPAQTATGPAAAPGSGTGAPLVNLNTASEAELQTLPRVGPVLASRIIAWRTEHGPFQRAEDLDAVPGIGEAMLAALLPLVSV